MRSCPKSTRRFSWFPSMVLAIAGISLAGIGVSRLTATAIGQDRKPQATPEALVSALTAADDARVAAMRMPEIGKLEAIFSDELRYAHSTGTIDTKKTFIEVLTSGKTKYQSMDYVKREFTFPAPGIALMVGQVKAKVKTTETAMENTLSFLAVWRLENGSWRFLAWQSCRLPAPAQP